MKRSKVKVFLTLSFVPTTRIDSLTVTRPMANTTGVGNFTSKLSSPPAGIEFLSAFNIFLAITASIGNLLILIALHKVSCIHPPTKLFFRCLAVTDLGVGLIVQPLYVTIITSPLIKKNIYDVFYARRALHTFSWCLCGVSLLTSTAISVDRLLALLLGLRYRHVVTLRRVRVVIICFWLTGALSGWARMQTPDLAHKEAVVILTLSLVTMIFCYTTIHFKLRHQQAQLHDNVPQNQIPNGGEMPLNIARYKKTVCSILWLQLALVTCYLPSGIVMVLPANGISYVAWRSTETLVYLNSSLNPILYCWKIREVKQAVRDTMRTLYSFQLLN